MSATCCQSCASPGLQGFYTVRDVPVHSCLLLDDRADALAYPRGDVELAFCPDCGLIQNVAFDPDVMEYCPDYEDSQAHSPRFVDFATELSEHLDARYGLRDRSVVEIGCGKGDFLTVLSNATGCLGVGFDPAYRPGPLHPDHPERLRFVADLYDERYANVPADLVVCRHTLEHVLDVHTFVSMVRRCIDDRRDTVVFFEVPDVTRILARQAFWDIYYEHCVYFSPGSLARLFQSCGFDLLDLRVGFDGQYLLLEARPGGVGVPQLVEGEPHALAALVSDFRERVPKQLADLRTQLDTLVDGGSNVVLWGASSKAVSYLNGLHVAGEVSGVVDVNGRKHGRYLAGTGHRILSPAELPAHGPDAVLLMNPVYADEVARTLRDLGVEADLRTVGEGVIAQPRQRKSRPDPE